MGVDTNLSSSAAATNIVTFGVMFGAAYAMWRRVRLNELEIRQHTTHFWTLCLRQIRDGVLGTIVGGLAAAVVAETNAPDGAWLGAALGSLCGLFGGVTADQRGTQKTETIWYSSTPINAASQLLQRPTYDGEQVEEEETKTTDTTTTYEDESNSAAVRRILNGLRV